MVPRCKHLLALFSHPHHSGWPPLLLLSPHSHTDRFNWTAKQNCACHHHSTYSSFCQCVLRIKVETTCMGTSSLSLPSSEHPPPPSKPRQMLPSPCVCVCVGHSPRVKCNLFLHSGKAPLLLSARQVPSGGWQANCQQWPSRPVKVTRVSQFPWSRWRCQPDIPLTRHP